MRFLLMSLGVALLLAGINAVAVWFGSDVAAATEDLAPEH